ncbi:putative membrane protein [Neobacillus sp. B4I6]
MKIPWYINFLGIVLIVFLLWIIEIKYFRILFFWCLIIQIVSLIIDCFVKFSKRKRKSLKRLSRN